MLWLPVLGADLLSFFLTKEQKQVAHLVIYRLVLDAPSVLSGAKHLPAPGDPSSHALILKAAAIGAIFQWSVHFIQIVLYAISLFMIVALVRTIQQRRESSFLSAIQFVRSKWTPIVALSLRVLGSVALVGILFVYLVSTAVTKHLVRQPSVATYAFICVGFCGITYFLAPIAMRRIAAGNSDSLTPEQTRHGRIFALLTVIASSLLGYGLPYVASSFTRERPFNNYYAVRALPAINSLITAAPYIVLFIALTLIVDDELIGVATAQETSADI